MRADQARDVLLHHGWHAEQVDEMLNAYRVKVLNEAADRAEDTATHLRRNYATEESNGAMNAASDIRALATPAAAPFKEPRP